jgi:hypothetical protein
MRPALDPASHRVPRTKPTCLLHTWRPHRRRPFALVLHLHQHQSSRNLHLHYLAKNQSTQRCQSLITQGSDHPPVLEPHMVLTPVVSRYPAPAPIDDFVLLFLPPCGPHLTPLSTGSLELGLLVSPLLGGPARHRPFAPTLHLHQRKSRRNLHLQYSAKSQSTPRCQSLITARSDHPPVLGCSGPQQGYKHYS